MAIATGGLLGYRLPENFLFPYFAFNLSDFWRRWHVTLSTWVRDYLFYSIGGSRGSEPRVYFNILFSFTIIGLWHGAAWTFVAFGALHGLFLSAERLWARLLPDERCLPRRAVHCLGPLIMNLCHMVAMVFFRSRDFASVGSYLGTMFLGGGGVRRLDPAWWWAVAGFTLAHFAMYRGFLRQRARALPDWAFSIVLGVSFGLALAFSAREVAPFVYFQF
ncbi:MAG: hypothetical protein HY812_16560 [Planctomycetes bacterium]|nr:hypothetical protein [Planctomycetota bacterium]